MHCLLFLRDTYQRKLTLGEVADKESKLVNELTGIYKIVKPAEQKSFFNNPELLLLREEKFFQTLKAKYFY